jgi:hypothetical protein
VPRTRATQRCRRHRGFWHRQGTAPSIYLHGCGVLVLQRLHERRPGRVKSGISAHQPIRRHPADTRLWLDACSRGHIGLGRSWQRGRRRWLPRRGALHSPSLPLLRQPAASHSGVRLAVGPMDPRPRIPRLTEGLIGVEMPSRPCRTNEAGGKTLAGPSRRVSHGTYLQEGHGGAPRAAAGFLYPSPQAPSQYMSKGWVSHT